MKKTAFVYVFSVMIVLIVNVDTCYSKPINPTTLTEVNGRVVPTLDPNYPFLVEQGSTQHNLNLNAENSVSFSATSDLSMDPNLGFCTPPKLIDPNLPATLNQTHFDMEGRYMVWAQLDKNNFTGVVRGYDMGPDETFGTIDDIGLQSLFTTKYGLAAESLPIYPRVNRDGLVAFTYTSDYGASNQNVHLATCHFSSCVSTLHVWDSISFVFGVIPLGSFTTFDLDLQQLVVARLNFNNNTSSVIRHDLTTELSDVLVQEVVPPSPQFHFFQEVGVEDGLVSYRRHFGSLTGESIMEFYIIPKLGATPILVTEGNPYQIPSLAAMSDVLSSKGYKIRNSNMAVYVKPDIADKFWDLKYKIQSPAGLSPEYTLSDESGDQFLPRLGFNKKSNQWMLAYADIGSLQSSIKVKTYNPKDNYFLEVDSIVPSMGWERLVPLFVNNSQIGVILIDDNMQITRIAISACLSAIPHNP